MSVHEQFAEDLALYALGSLEGDEKLSLEKHLQECASCRRELDDLRGSAALLALSASGPRPPARSKSRLMDAIAKEPRARTASSPTRWWSALGWAAAAAMLIFAAAMWNQNQRLKSSINEWADLSSQQRQELEGARRVVDTLTANDAMRVTVLPVGVKAPLPEGKAIYSRQRNGLIFMASNLRPLPAQKAYELWLIPTTGNPIPAGVFKPDARGTATVVNPPLPQGIEAKAFAITVEPETGSTTPTKPIIMMGAGG
ncbi:MAG: anti-sigma factor [Terriglobales bacterium]